MKEPSPFEVAPREPGEKAGVFKNAGKSGQHLVKPLSPQPT
ncbi:hypothetical protein HMPREF0580_1237 [Mobiluncus mulieris ATCC 35239]|uniref:Uncharacterized protein n=1 Tax=Mobiluncus mulieris ATCC 35239 TaxID=871571 RepID=E0QQS2_9ACTO|nr:hypothetical protein HMPREF0580_1237 [Mobiluncus mulieris ATCC 35239]MCU9970987.1 peptide chain release factor 2 [Mobiluncus mulieris]MCU9975260.1 peptide chain release factor 2 [Mobiluncus mulieris]MCU9993277.1 peptide chain release factor 2 [Mobiluncus mulieris]MCV0013664.1 peptide chain release factor 2 [Mobiluncus mulieris]